MQRYGLYDATRGLTTLAAAAGAGVLLWAATLVGQQTDKRFWAEMGIVAGAGLVMALSQVIGGWTKGLRLRVSPSTFLLAFLPVLIVVGWILMATQPHNGWYQPTFHRWTSDIGMLGLVHNMALWHGALALGFGLVLGLSFDTVPALEPAAAPVAAAAPLGARRVPARRQAVNEPITAERREVGMPGSGRPQEVTVGPRDSETPSSMD
jgi:hypothetical protein